MAALTILLLAYAFALGFALGAIVVLHWMGCEVTRLRQELEANATALKAHAREQLPLL